MTKGIEFEADGEDGEDGAAATRHVLRFDFNALCRLEEDFGCSIEDVALRLGDDGRAPRMGDLRMAFRAGLGGGHTLEEAGDLMSRIGFQRAGALIGEAIKLAFPQADPATAERTRQAGKPKARA